MYNTDKTVVVYSYPDHRFFPKNNIIQIFFYGFHLVMTYLFNIDMFKIIVLLMD